jgi:2'-5' RNA ligase
MSSSSESVLVALVPEAEALVKPFRDRYDPSAAAGMPAHVTLLYPFKLPDELDDALLANLRHCFARFAPFRFALTSISRFPVEVLYLAPEPDEPFRRLTLAIWERYPETPPYGGKWPDIIPHLSVASLADERRLGCVADEFAQACRRKLPIHARAAEVALMVTRSGRWQIHSMLRLGI